MRLSTHLCPHSTPSGAVPRLPESERMFVCLVTMRTMKPGHPYLTEELDNLRSAQRKLLAGIPDRWLTAAFPVFQGATTPQALPTDLDRHRLESDFRALLQDRY